MATEAPGWTADFSGCHALVTGASGGLGSAVIRLFTRHGASATLLGHPERQHELDALAAELARAGYSVHALAVDVTSPDQVAGAFSVANRELGPVTSLVNVAGIYETGELALDDTDAWHRALAVNLLGARDTCRAFLTQAPSGTYRTIVNISSDSARDVAAGDGIYATSKAALEVYTRHLALEQGPSGVRVNAIAPGWMRTAMTESIWSDPVALAEAERGVALGYLAQPDAVAQVALFLSSGAASYITGQVLTVNGGRSFS
ncbi:SDR family NAD(P)-dependent oxidoreductase [Pseudohaliea sp.]|uniref:SDR family NAD(P)-dependent oxidoreductase n=1 Tax=Pseudohaliea sp. TaxID=2740289 RepID=UPI0032EC8FE7